MIYFLVRGKRLRTLSRRFFKNFRVVIVDPPNRRSNRATSQTDNIMDFLLAISVNLNDRNCILEYASLINYGC